ncbi:MAG: cadmium-translocating P-type ATPase [Bacilli bacterium]|nr:cadmium-translocating P-type ATPase [Bacilli bacterium]
MEEERSKKDYIILGIRIALTVALIVLGMVVFNETSYPWYVNLIVMGVAYLVISYDIILEMIEGIFKEHEFFGEATLMVLASIGAFCLRLFGPSHNEYMEGVLVILLFQIGEVLEDLAADKSKEAILNAIDLKEYKAKVVVGERIEEKESKDLSIGDIVLCANGEKLLCDGIVKEGKGEVDESSLTGESNPIYKEIGAPIYAGTVLVEGSLKVEVNKEYDDSSVGKLAKMIEEANEGKSRSERFITKFSKIYTPIVMAIALLVAVIPPLFLGISDGDIWSRWIYSALAFLVVSCPCAIVISVPLAYVAGLGLASRNGVLVKGAAYFDALNSLDTVAFDKTGTMTEGKLSLVELCPNEVEKEELLDTLKIAESGSEHPLAKAVFNGEERINYEYESYTEIPGKGIKVIYKGETLLAGKIALLKEEKVEIKEGVLVTDKTAIFVAKNGVYLGYAVFEDKLKENSVRFVNELKKDGIKTVLLSGDQAGAVKNAGELLGVDEYRSELLPSEKLAYIEGHKVGSKGTIAYLGDGINDAPTLVASDVGVAMGGLGSDLAVANADVAILNDDPLKFLALKKIAKATQNRAIFNVVFSLAAKFIIVFLGVLASAMGTWQLPLWVSVLGDSGVAILAIASSLLLHFKTIKV